MKTNARMWLTLSRITAALLGGYAFTYTFTAAVARLLPFDPIDAMITATLLSFVVYTLAILWAFACRSLFKVWVGVALALPLGVIGLWPQLMERVG